VKIYIFKWAQDGHKLIQLIVLNGKYKNKLDTLDSGF